VNAVQKDIQELAADYDHTSEEQMTQPYAMYERFRNECPLGHSDNHGGFWFVSRYDDVVAVAKNFRKFSNKDGVAIPKQPTTPMYPLDLDPPLHTAFRTVLMPLFLKSEAEKLTSQVEAEVDRLLDPIIAAGEGDFAVISNDIPTIFALQVIGIAGDAAAKLTHWVDVLTHERLDAEKAAAAGAEFQAFIINMVAQRRNEPRKDDVISALLDKEVAGIGMLDDDAISRVIFVLIFGGLHTSRSAMLESLLYVNRRPDIKQTLIEHMNDEAFWAVAVEEFIRYSTPTQCVKRQAAQDSELHGMPIKAGDNIMMMWGSANHDETKFSNPEAVILDRTPNQHTSFGVGAHVCIGQHLARVFIRSVLKRVLTRIPDFRVPENFEPEYMVGESRAMISLPVKV
jgi:cytochrome P450